MVRCGIVDRKSWLELMGRDLTDVMRRPGRHVQSVTESSFDAWTKFYQQDEDAPNAIVSYYTKVFMVALALDLTLRLDGDSSLDAVMRVLYERYGETGEGVPEDGVQAVAAELTDLDLSAFFDEALNGTGDAIWERLVGLLTAWVSTPSCVHGRAPRTAGKAGKAKEDTWADRGDSASSCVRVVPRCVLSWTTARHMPGSTERDHCGEPPAGADLPSRVAKMKPGQEVDLHVFRRDELHTLRATLRAAPCDTVVLSLQKDPSASAGHVLDEWIGAAT